MNTHHILLIIHLLCAAIWVGGHVFLLIRVLPNAYKKNDSEALKRFKASYEPVGMPSLVILVITGVIMAYDFGVPIKSWFSFSYGIEKVVSLKLILLFSTFVLAIIADRIIFPKLNDNNIKNAIFPISVVTILGICMLILGSFVRYGGI